MNDLSLKNAAYIDGAKSTSVQRGKDDSTRSIATTFQNLVNNMGKGIESGVAALSAQSGFMGLAAKSELTSFTQVSTDDSAVLPDDITSGRKPSHYRDDYHETGRENESRQDFSSRPSDAPRHDTPVERNTDTTGRPDARGNGHYDGSDDSAQNPHTTETTSEARHNTSTEGPAEVAEGRAETTQAGTTQAAASQTATQAGAAANISGLAMMAVGNQVAATATGKTQSNNNTIGGPAHADEGEASEQGKSSALQGLAIATTKSGKAKGQHGPATAGNNENAMTGANQKAASQQGPAQAETVKSVTAQLQAETLARNLGSNTQVKVTVNIDSEADGLVSKPTNTLSNTSILTENGKGQGQSGQNSHNGQNGNHSATLVNAQQAQNAQVQNQQGNRSAPGTGTQQMTDVKGMSQSGGQATQATAEGSAANSNSVSGSNQQAQQTQQANKAADAQAKNPLHQSQHNKSVTEQVAVQITKALKNGTDKIKIQLSPSELGRVEIKMELTADGRAMAVVHAESKDTMELLRRDASELQKALADAGIDLDSDDLEFTYSGQEEQRADDEGHGTNQLAADEIAEADEFPATDGEVMTALEAGILANGHIDFRA